MYSLENITCSLLCECKLKFEESIIKRLDLDLLLRKSLDYFLKFRGEVISKEVEYQKRELRCLDRVGRKADFVCMFVLRDTSMIRERNWNKGKEYFKFLEQLDDTRMRENPNR